MVCGFDVAAEGDNWSVLAPTQGPKVHELIAWKGKNITDSANYAAEQAEKLGAVRVQYDCNGPGEGIKGHWDSIAKSQDTSLPFEAVPIIGGARPDENRKWADGKTSVQKFANCRAEMWWELRVRFEKTYEHVKALNGEEGGHLHDINDLISIPRDGQLISELSTPLIGHTNAGKIQIEGKNEMRKRGVRSPDRADALAYAYYRKPKKIEFWFR
jgi:phage terminase large subunit